MSDKGSHAASSSPTVLSMNVLNMWQRGTSDCSSLTVLPKLRLSSAVLLPYQEEIK